MLIQRFFKLASMSAFAVILAGCLGSGEASEAQSQNQGSNAGIEDRDGDDAPQSEPDGQQTPGGGATTNGGDTQTPGTSKDDESGTGLELDDEPSASQPPEWSEDEAYLKGDRVSYEGSVYEAESWSRGDRPSENAETNPWKFVTRLDDSADGNTSSDAWTFVDGGKTGPYGEHQFKVPAAQNWVNTGVYLQKGETATISATGLWQIKPGEAHGPEGGPSGTDRGCRIGQLTARIGLRYDDEKIFCVGREQTLTAHRDGILFVGALAGNDLGETYESRVDASGEVSVSVRSQADTVPLVPVDTANYYAYGQVESGWVELKGEHVVLTLPAPTAAQDANKLQSALNRLDAIYKKHRELRGAVPYDGQPIRIYPDSEETPGWMLAGNPIRLDPALVDPGNDSRVTLSGQPDNNNWGLAHELGHNFNFVDGNWTYTTDVGLEAWPNVYTIHAIEKLNLPARDLDCPSRKSQFMTDDGSNDALNDSPWAGICFLMEFKDRYGWEFFRNFHASLNQQPGSGWSFMRERFSQAAGEDVNAVFDNWGLPK